MPRKAPENIVGIKQIPFRIHMNDKVLLYKLLEDADITFQQFMTACVEGFLRGDPSAMKIIKDWRALNSVPKDWKDRYSLSHRERDMILDEIEYLDDVEPVTHEEKDGETS